MAIIWTIIVAIATFILGHAILPLLTAPISWVVMIVLRPISKIAGWFIGRYGSFFVEAWLYFVIVRWMGDHTSAWMPLAWIVFAFCVFTAFNTLYIFDVQCYKTRSGIWYIASDEFAAHGSADE